MKAILAILAAVILLSSVAVMIPQAHAASAIGGVEQRIKVNTADGYSCYWTSFKELKPQTLIGNACSDQAPKNIVSFQFEIWAEFYSNDYTVTGHTLSNTVKVLARDGTYKAVPVSGGSLTERVFPPANAIWKLYQSTVTASALEAVMGTGLYDYTADIRITTTAGSVTVKNAAGSTTTQSITSQTTSFSFSQKGTSSGGDIGGTPEIKPTGKLYYVITISKVQGGTATITSANIGSLKLLDVAVVGEGSPFSSIEYELRLHLDNDGFVVDTPKYDAPLAGGINYESYVNDQPVNKQVEQLMRYSNTGDYRILSMRVQGSDITPMLSEIGNDGTTVFKNGKITFKNAHAKIPISSTSKTYNVDMPAQSLTYDLVSADLVAQPGPCEIDGESCDPISGAGIDTNAVLIGGGIAAVLVGGALAIKRRR